MKCFAEECPAEPPMGDVFCSACWRKLPRAVRVLLWEEQRRVKANRSRPAKRWETTMLEAIEYLHRIFLDESMARAKPLTLTSEKGLLGKLADQVLGRVKGARDFVVVVREDAPEVPVYDGRRVFVRDLGALRVMLTAAKRSA